ncbi:MAG: hypothetical protein R3B47_06525 [Bacteroidia bacterium]
MKQLIIIFLSIVAIASLIVLISQQPHNPELGLSPVKVVTDSLISPAQPAIAGCVE